MFFREPKLYSSLSKSSFLQSTSENTRTFVIFFGTSPRGHDFYRKYSQWWWWETPKNSYHQSRRISSRFTGASPGARHTQLSKCITLWLTFHEALRRELFVPLLLMIEMEWSCFWTGPSPFRKWDVCTLSGFILPLLRQLRPIIHAAWDMRIPWRSTTSVLTKIFSQLVCLPFLLLHENILRLNKNQILPPETRCWFMWILKQWMHIPL